MQEKAKTGGSLHHIPGLENIRFTDSILEKHEPSPLNAYSSSPSNGFSNTDSDQESGYYFLKSATSTTTTMLTFTPKEWMLITRKTTSPSRQSFKEVEMNLCAGIPDNLRPRIWMYLTKGITTTAMTTTTTTSAAQLTFKQFEALSKKVSPSSDEQILKDISRTLPQHRYFSSTGKGQRALFMLLRAYANFDAEIGYVQGMNFIAAHILLNLRCEQYANQKQSFAKESAISDEEQTFLAFRVFVHVMCEQNWRETYANTLVRHRVMITTLIESLPATLANHFTLINLDTTTALSTFYLTLFMKTAPFPLARRIIDVFLIVGPTLMNRVLRRILVLAQHEILQINDPIEASIYISEYMLPSIYSQYKRCMHYLFETTEEAS